MRVDEASTLKLESQKLHARAFDGSTQPHCKHVVVTGVFCAADASTPVRRERDENTITREKASEECREDDANAASFSGEERRRDVLAALS